MAIAPGMLCMNCEKPARDDSHFCSGECASAFVTRLQGPVQCEECMYEVDTVAEAKRAKWTGIEPAPEGFSYNFGGLCPDCRAERKDKRGKP